MDFQSFKSSLAENNPPNGLSPLLRSLWYEASGDWHQAHQIVQEIPGADAAWVHAYLHRREGDAWNAGYWYSRAGRARSALSLDEEWAQITTEMLAGEGA